MQAWNVVATTLDQNFAAACRLLGLLGRVRRTHFHNVVTMKVPDPRAFAERVRTLIDAHPETFELVGRIVPAQRTFDFATPADFDAKAAAVMREWAPQIAGKSFHVRMHRRGFKGELHSQDEERLLDDTVLDAAVAAGALARINFDDPDIVIDVETVDDRAGFSIWTREELARYPFLKTG